MSVINKMASAGTKLPPRVSIGAANADPPAPFQANISLLKSIIGRAKNPKSPKKQD